MKSQTTRADEANKVKTLNKQEKKQLKKIKIIAFNIDGFKNDEKRKTIQTICKGYSIVILTETHAESVSWKTKWDKETKYQWESYWSIGQSHKKGVTILINKTLADTLSINLHDTCKNGTYVWMKIKKLVPDHQEINIVGIYAPHKDIEKDKWWKQMNQKIKEQHTPTILAGDFNFVTDTKLDKIGGTPNKIDKGSKYQKELETLHNFTDIWRQQHPGEKAVTWVSHDALNSTKSKETVNITKKKLVGKRLDRFLITKNLVTLTTDSEVVSTEISDHDAISITVVTNTPKHGRGIWRLNNQLHENTEFQAELGRTMQEIIHDPARKGITTKLRTITKETKQLAQSIGKKMKKEREENIAKLTQICEQRKQKMINQTEEINANIIWGNSNKAQEITKDFSKSTETLKETKQQIIKIMNETRQTEDENLEKEWIKEGEKPTTFFFNKGKEKLKSCTIEALRDHRTEDVKTRVTKQKKLEKKVTDFYEDLFSEKKTDPCPQENWLD